MFLLLGFAFLSGLLTITAPCIWPLLPIVLSSTTTGGHRKPLGVTLGIISSFAVFTLTLSYIVKIIPLNLDGLRILAVVIIAFFGLALIIPQFSQIVEGWVSSLSGKVARPQQGTGFVSGLLTGFSLGIIWSPCAGPILATIATLAATRAVNLEIIFVTVTYVIGIGIPLFLFATFGRLLITKSRALSQYTGRIQQVFGVIMILTAFAIATNYDKVLQANLLNAFPSYSNFLNQFEGNGAVKEQLDRLKRSQSWIQFESNTLFNTNSPAPEFSGITKWLNSPRSGGVGTDQPLTMTSFRGKVVLVDFWTYTCINCIRTLPYVTSWYDKYKEKGFVVVGVHTPEFEFEKETKNLENAIKQYSIHYPVAQDNDYVTWNAYSNQYWPAEYLIDKDGNVRRAHFGEGEYEETEKAIQKLLEEKGEKIFEKILNMPDQTPKKRISPETYLGSTRASYYYPNGSISNNIYTLTIPDSIPENSVALGGEWTISDEFATTGKNAALAYHFVAKNVFLVMRPGSNTSAIVKVYVDGKLLKGANAGEDVKGGAVIVSEDRLYRLIKLPDVSSHMLKLEFQTSGTEVFAFTFG